jgi:hypothetical protein
MHAEIPVFINCRDRVTCLELLVGWLESAGCERIVLVDNDSTYPPLLEYYERTPHQVVRLGTNAGHRAPWDQGIVEAHTNGPYVVSDPDVVPTEECPRDAIAHLSELLQRHADRCKAGLGLAIDDLPEHYALADYVRAWEAQHWEHELEPGVFDAPVDTTFAVYRAGVPFAKKPSLRTGSPYLARHLPWYIDSERLTDEERYYRQHMSLAANTWNQKRLAPKVDGYFHRSPLARARRLVRSWWVR